MRALVLSGGGARGAYQVGALKRILKDGDYEIVCGVSVGAINAAFLCQFPIGDAKALLRLEALWSNLTTAKVYTKRSLGLVAALWNESVYDSTPLWSMVRAHFDANKVVDSGRKLRLGAVSWNTGEYRAATERTRDLDRWILASSAFPVFFTPVPIDGQLWGDGGIRNVTPIGDAIRAGADRIDIVLCSPSGSSSKWDPAHQRAVPGFAFRTIELMADEIVRGDLEAAGLKNDLAKTNPKYKVVSVRVLEPAAPLLDSLDFSPKNIESMKQRGYEDAASRSWA